MAVLDVTAFAKQSIRLIKKQHRPAGLRPVKQALQVLFRLTNVFADDGGQIDPEQVQPDFVGNHLCRQSLAGPRLSGKQGDQPLTLPCPKPPVAIHLFALPHMPGNVAQDRRLPGWQDQIGKGGIEHHPLCHLLQPAPRRDPRRLPDHPAALCRRRGAHLFDNPVQRGQPQMKLPRRPRQSRPIPRRLLPPARQYRGQGAAGIRVRNSRPQHPSRHRHSGQSRIIRPQPQHRHPHPRHQINRRWHHLIRRHRQYHQSPGQQRLPVQMSGNPRQCHRLRRQSGRLHPHHTMRGYGQSQIPSRRQILATAVQHHHCATRLGHQPGNPLHQRPIRRINRRPPRCKRHAVQNRVGRRHPGDEMQYALIHLQIGQSHRGPGLRLHQMPEPQGADRRYCPPMRHA